MSPPGHPDHAEHYYRWDSSNDYKVYTHKTIYTDKYVDCLPEKIKGVEPKKVKAVEHVKATYEVYEEDVDAEAEEFIELEHKKFSRLVA